MPKKLKTLLFFVGVMLMIVVAVYLVGTYLQAARSIVIDKPIYQYVAGQRISFDGRSKLEDQEGNITIRSDSYTGNLANVPLFQSEESCMYILSPMEIVQPLTSFKTYKVNSLSAASIRDGEVMLGKAKNGEGITNGFLFDGKDTYVFLEPVTVTCRDESMKMHPLSYAIVRYGQFMELYDYATDSYRKILLGVESEVMAVTENYSINLNYDILNINGKQELLFGKPADLPEYEG